VKFYGRCLFKGTIPEFLVRLKKTVKNVRHSSRYSNPESVEYEAGVIATGQRLSVHLKIH
jgi:hypothetical protein